MRIVKHVSDRICRQVIYDPCFISGTPFYPVGDGSYFCMLYMYIKTPSEVKAECPFYLGFYTLDMTLEKTPQTLGPTLNDSYFIYPHS